MVWWNRLEGDMRYCCGRYERILSMLDEELDLLLSFGLTVRQGSDVGKWRKRRISVPAIRRIL